MDSITKVTAEDAGAYVVPASHEGASSGEFALGIPLAAVVFSHAGVGKERRSKIGQAPRWNGC